MFSSLWIGLLEVSASDPASAEWLDGCPGAFVTFISHAVSREDYLEKAAQCLQLDYSLEIIGESDVETVYERRSACAPGDDILDAILLAENTREHQYGPFFSYRRE